MLGAIIGDIVGSVYEWNNIKTKEFPLFREDCFFTDDTVMTIAVADAIMQMDRDKLCGPDAEMTFAAFMKKWGRMYPNAGYGGRFSQWLATEDDQPYNSWGNGSAMRVSPCACATRQSFLANENIDQLERLAKTSAMVTHNHEEGIKGAVETARAIWYMQRANAYANDTNRFQYWKQMIIRHSAYDLTKTLDEIRPTYTFNESCQETVPQAIIAFLESTDFEDAIRNAISLGGDSDTLAAITGSIAEAAYGIPDLIKKRAWTYLDEPTRDVCRRWSEYLKHRVL